MSSIVQISATAHQPLGHSVAVPFYPSPPQWMEKGVPFSTLFILGKRKKSQGAKSANLEDVQVLECVYWEETS